MNWKACWIALAVVGLGLAACQSTRPDRDWVQTNVVDKDLFQGEWHYARTVVDSDMESEWLMAFVGDTSFSVEGSISFSIPRVRWVIDENYLYAFRADPIVTGADEDEFEPDYYSGVIAAFPVETHLDIIRSYNPITGERLNVVAEDTSERAWYDRQYMRVDWSQNLVTGFNWTYTEAMGMDGFITRQSTTFTCNEGTDQPYEDADGNALYTVCREEWLPQVRLTDPEFDAVYGHHYADELRDEACRNPVTGQVSENCDGSGLPFMFSFVNQEIWSPTIDAMGYMSYYPFTSVRVTVRNTFVRSPERSSYEPLLTADTMWDRFGAFRLERGVYSGGEGADPVEGIEPLRGLTDMLEYWAARHNIWVDYRNDAGEIIPPADRQRRRIVYYLNAGFPKWVAPAAFRVADEWNDQFMRATYLAQGLPLPADRSGYDCQVTRGDEGFTSKPERFSEYDGIYSNPSNLPRFEGEDCVLVLRVNSADLEAGTYTDSVGTRIIVRHEDGSIDAESSNVEPYGELLGDFRFQFLNAIENPGARFGGISTLRADVRNGQLITANASVAMESMLRSMTIALQWLGINASLCSDDDIVDPSLCTYMQGLDLPGLEDIMNGEDVRSYFAEIGKVERPISPVTPEALNSPSTEYNVEGISSVLHGIIGERMSMAAEKAAGLAGTEGDLLTYGHRLVNLKGTRIESMLFDNPETLAMLAGKSGFEGAKLYDLDPSSADVLDEISFFRTSPAEQLYLEQRKLDRMASLNMYPEHPMLDYGYAQLAEEYAAQGWNASQIAMHIGQTTLYNVMVHELGHSIGMRHNFAGSIDYRNYRDCYWNIADDHPWPEPHSFTEDPIQVMGGMTFEETVDFSRAVEQVDDERDMAGMNMCQSTSTMDYTLNYVYDDPGLGKYDAAYVDFMYAGMTEAYVGDPRAVSLSGSRKWEELDPRGHDKVHWIYYPGGQVCETDADCPYSAGRLTFPGTQQIKQTCRANPRLPLDATSPGATASTGEARSARWWPTGPTTTTRPTPSPGSGATAGTTVEPPTGAS
ncbi:MAG: hypothetical protein JRG91_07850 [Deltaproteobacteria bacterium]|nr:hypothetical protein [Deltaproteobacteria bacterium]